MSGSGVIEKAHEATKQRYAELDVDTDKAMERLSKVAISLHCWQGDDVGGFETRERRTHRWRHNGHWKLSRKGPDGR